MDADNVVLYITEPRTDESDHVKKDTEQTCGVIIYDPVDPDDPGAVVLCERCSKWQHAYDMSSVVELDLEVIFGNDWLELRV
jgi:hypothetical protein